MATHQEATTGEIVDDGKGSAADKIPEGQMKVKIHSPYKVYYDGMASSVSGVNTTGPFDILPKHHNFMSLLAACDIVVRHEKGEEVVPINRGVMHVKADKVVVFLDV